MDIVQRGNGFQFNEDLLRYEKINSSASNVYIFKEDGHGHRTFNSQTFILHNNCSHAVKSLPEIEILAGEIRL